MNILHLIPSYYPAFQFGGPIYSVHLLCKTLVKKNIKVTVYTTNVGIKNKKEFRGKRNIDGVEVHYFDSYGYENYTFSPQLTLSLYQNLKKYDLVHITAVWNYSTAIGSFLCRKFKMPYVISPRGTLYEYVVKKKSYLIKKVYYRLISKRDLEEANYIHFTTEDEFEKTVEFLRINNENCCVIPNGIDLDEYKNLPPKGEFKKKYSLLKDKDFILFLGRVNWKKGLDLLIRAFKDLTVEYENLHLVIVGHKEEPYTSRIKDMIKKYNLEKKILFTGILTGRDKLSAFVDAKVFVLPSYSENFGMSVIEAMACGIPVVISNKVGIWKEAKKYRAGVIVENCVEKIYEGIRNILEDETLAFNLSMNAKSMVEEYYDIKKVVDQMQKIYKILKNR